MMGDLGKLIVAKGFKNLPKVQKIARSGHTGLSIIINFETGESCSRVQLFKDSVSGMLFGLSNFFARKKGGDRDNTIN